MLACVVCNEMNKAITLFDGDDEIKHELPAKFEVCDRCDGHGMHLTPSIGNHAYSQEEFEESFPEPEDRAEYFRRGGIYDVRCEECKGERVVSVVDESRLNTEQKAIYAAYEKQKQEAWEDGAEQRSEARMERMMMGDYD